MIQILEILHSAVWGPWTLVLFLGTGLMYTIRSRGFQLCGIRTWMSATIGSLKGTGNETGKITPFQSACTALSATIGTGNIAGVATALACGGSGALVWMWISAAIGMMTAYGETYLGQKYRYRGEDGHWMCGPMVYMERGLGSPFLGGLYAGLAVLASFGMGSMVQANSISQTLNYEAHVPVPVCAAVITVLTALVVTGGIRRIARFSELLLPASAGIYLFFSMTLILSCLPQLPGIFAEIFREALHPRPAAGGIAGFLMSGSVRYGLARGVFSNEAGLGSLAVLHGAAEDTTPEQQGMWAMFEVFFDTMVVCTLTALAILCMQRHMGISSAEGPALAAEAFAWRFGSLGRILVSGSMVVFAFGTIVAWYYLGMQSFAYFLGRLNISAGIPQLYAVLYLLSVFAGSICRLDVVWVLADIWNGLMAFPNLVALLWMAREVPAFCDSQTAADRGSKSSDTP